MALFGWNFNFIKRKDVLFFKNINKSLYLSTNTTENLFFRPGTAIIKLVKKPAFFSYLPSKKFIITAISVLIAGLGIFWALSQKGFEKTREIFPENLSVKSIFSKAEQKDSDNDGLFDWEEALWGTDINNPDTDGDGTRDGEEAKSGRDPLKKGPDDKLQDSKIFTQKSGEEIPDGWTKTDVLARDFFAKFFTLQQSGNLNQENKDKLTESFLAGMEQEKILDQYKISDIKTVNDNSKEAMKLYGSKLEGVFNSHIIPENELIIFERAIKNQDKKEMQKLEPIAAAYYKASQEILAIEAPSSISELHLNLINNFFNIAKCIERMGTSFQDPVNALAGLKLYQKNIQSSYSILTEFKSRSILNNL